MYVHLADSVVFRVTPAEERESLLEFTVEYFFKEIRCGKLYNLMKIALKIDVSVC